MGKKVLISGFVFLLVAWAANRNLLSAQAVREGRYTLDGGVFFSQYFGGYPFGMQVGVTRYQHHLNFSHLTGSRERGEQEWGIGYHFLPEVTQGKRLRPYLGVAFHFLQVPDRLPDQANYRLVSSHGFIGTRVYLKPWWWCSVQSGFSRELRVTHSWAGFFLRQTWGDVNFRFGMGTALDIGRRKLLVTREGWHLQELGKGNVSRRYPTLELSIGMVHRQWVVFPPEKLIQVQVGPRLAGCVQPFVGGDLMQSPGVWVEDSLRNMAFGGRIGVRLLSSLGTRLQYYGLASLGAGHQRYAEGWVLRPGSYYVQVAVGNGFQYWATRRLGVRVEVGWRNAWVMPRQTGHSLLEGEVGVGLGYVLGGGG